MSLNPSEVKPDVTLPIDEALHECQRELQVRQRCYTRWVKEGKLTQFEATERGNRLAAAIVWLQKLLDRETAVAAQ